MSMPDWASEIYQPDSTVTSPEAREICARIARFSLRHEYVEGKRYVSSLSDEDLTKRGVATEAVSIFTQDGDYAGAKVMLRRVQLEKRMVVANALMDENTALLALIAAWVDCATDFKVAEALTLVDTIDQIYMSREWSLAHDFEDTETRKRGETINQQRQLWQPEHATSYDDACRYMTDSRLCIEDTALQILRRACDAGMFRKKHFDRRLKERCPAVIRYLFASNRHMMKATWILQWRQALPRSGSTGSILQTYLETLTTSDMRVIKAHVLWALSGSPGLEHAAEDNYINAASIFDEEGCQVSSTSLKLWHWKAGAGNTDASSDSSAAVTVLPTPEGGSTSRVDVLSSTNRERELRARSSLRSLAEIHSELLNFRNTLEQVQSVTKSVTLAQEYPFLWATVGILLDQTISQLVEKGDHWNAHLLQVRYYIEAANVFDLAEEARAFFSKVLSHPASAAIPEFFVAACKGMWRSCSKMSDYETALAYAWREYKHHHCARNEGLRSAVAYRIATSRCTLIINQVHQVPLDQGLVVTMQERLDRIIAFLEFWIDLDSKAGRTAAQLEKSRARCNALHSLAFDLDLKQYEDRWQSEAEALSRQSNLRGAHRLLMLQVLIRKHRWDEAIRFCDDLIRELDSTNTWAWTVGVPAAVAGILYMNGEVNGEMPDAVRKSMVTRQHDLLTSGLEALRVGGDGIFLLRALPLMWTFVECVKLWPERKLDYVRTITEYFKQAHEMCVDTSSHITMEGGIRQWLRKRALGSDFKSSSVCKAAAEFFLRCELYSTAWAWIQQSRTQVLRELLYTRSQSRQRLLISLESRPEIAKDLAEEQRLVTCVEKASPMEYTDALRQLRRHREKIKGAPLLRQIWNTPVKPDMLLPDNVDDIWALKRYLPQNCDVILVDWFIDNRRVIWRLSVRYGDRHAEPHWTCGYISMQSIENWQRQYLDFPHGEICWLERQKTALHRLRPLLTSLGARSEPGDLLVISTPGELAGIPIHGIPLDGKALIERNPIVYSSGLDLFRQCLKRAEHAALARSEPFLKDGCFMSAYEEEGHEVEQKAIFEELARMENRFGASSLLDDALTISSAQKAFETARWMHYHGHASYTKGEAINQCLVLGRLTEKEQQAQSRSGEDAHGQLAAEKPLEPPVTNPELEPSDASHEGTSHLAVADVYAMDLSATAPVMVNIACDSGVQEFSAGNDPLGLESALFCAGASSVVSTLWPIRSSTGRAFSKAFYDSLATQDSQSAEDTIRQHVNLAFAFRDAVLAVKKSRPDPYSWAAFTLQGAPLYFYGGERESARSD